MAKREKLKIVPQYIRNVTKSTLYAGSDFISNIMPASADFVSTNAEIFKSVTNDIRNFRSIARNALNVWNQSSMAKDVSGFKKNLFEDLRTGNFYNKQRTSKAVLEATGWGEALDFSDFDFGDFNFDDSDDDLDAEPKMTSGEKAQTKAQIMTASTVQQNTQVTATMLATSSNKISSSVAKSSEYLAEQQNAFFTMNNLNNQKMFSEMSGMVQDIATNVRGSFKYTENLTKYINATTPLLEKMSNSLNEMVALQKEYTEMQRNLYKEYDKSNEPVHIEDKNDFISGGFDISAYIGRVINKAKDMYKNSMVGSSVSMTGATESGLLSTFAASPLKFITDSIVNRLVSKDFKKSAERLDETINGFFGSAMLKLSSELKQRSEDNELFGTAYKLFGLDLGQREVTRTDQYLKGPMPFNGYTQQSIIEVIPTYLRQITAVITGQPEMIYNYKLGRFMTSKNIETQYKYDINSTYSGVSSTRYKVAGKIFDAYQFNTDDTKEINENIENFFKHVIDRGIFYDPNNMTYDKARDLGFYFTDQNIYNLINSAMKTLKSSELLDFNNSIISGIKYRKERNLEVNKELGLTGNSYMVNGTPEMKKYRGGIFAVDRYNRSIFNYMRDIRTILLEGIKVFPIYGAKKKYKNLGNNIDPEQRMVRYSNEIDLVTEEAERKERTKRELDDRNAQNARDKGVKSVIDNLDLMNTDNSYDKIKTVADSKNEEKKEEKKSDIKLINGTNSILKRLLGVGKSAISAPEKALIYLFDSINNHLMFLLYGHRDKRTNKSIMETFTDKINDMTDRIENYFQYNILNPLTDILFSENGLVPRFKKRFEIVWTKIKNTSTSFLGTISTNLFGKQSEKMSMSEFYEKNLKDRMPRIGIGAGIGALASFFTPLGLIGGTLMGSAVGFGTTSTKLKNYLFGEVGADGNRVGGKIPKKYIDQTKKGLKPMGIGAGVGLVASLFTPLGLVGGTIIGGIGGFISSFDKVKDFLFGKMGEDGTRDDSNALIKKAYVDKFKQYAPKAGIGAGLGILGSFFLPGGPIFGGLVGLATSLGVQSEKVKTFLFGEMDPDTDKRKGGMIGKATEWLKVEVAEPFKIWFQTLTSKAGYFVKKNMINPILDAFAPIKKQFQLMREGIVNGIKSGWEHMKTFVGGMFEKEVGKPFGQVIRENLTDPLKNFFSSIFKTLGKGVANLISLPFKGINKTAMGFMEKHKEQGIADYEEEWQKSKTERDKKTEEKYKARMEELRKKKDNNDKIRDVLEKGKYSPESIQQAQTMRNDQIIKATNNVEDAVNKSSSVLKDVLDDIAKTGKDVYDVVKEAVGEIVKDVKHEYRKAKHNKRNKKNYKKQEGKNANRSDNVIILGGEDSNINTDQSNDDNKKNVDEIAKNSNDIKSTLEQILETLKNQARNIHDKSKEKINDLKDKADKHYKDNYENKKDGKDNKDEKEPPNPIPPTNPKRQKKRIVQNPFKNAKFRTKPKNNDEDIPSHASGLDNVPNDDYKANLHEGEMVLPGDVANEMRRRAGLKEEKTSKVKGKKNKSNSFVNQIPNLFGSGDVLKKIYKKVNEIRDFIRPMKDQVKRIENNSMVTANSVDGQLNGLGYHTELIANILVEQFGPPAKMPKGAKVFSHKIKNIFSTIADIISAPFSFLFDLIKKPFRFLARIFEPVVNVVNTVITTIAKIPITILNTAKTLIGKTLDIFNTVARGAVTIFNSLTKALPNILKSAGNFINGAIKTSFTILEEAAKGIRTVFVDLASIGKTLVKGAFELGIKIIPKLVSGLGSIGKFIFNAVKKVGKTVWSIISYPFRKRNKKVKNIKTVESVNTVKTVEVISRIDDERLYGRLDSIIEAINGRPYEDKGTNDTETDTKNDTNDNAEDTDKKEKKRTFKDTLKEKANNLKDKAKEQWEFIKFAFQYYKEIATDKAKDIFNDLKGKASEKLDFMKFAFQYYKEVATDKAKTVFNNVKDKANEKLDFMKFAFQYYKETLGESVKNKFNQGKEFVLDKFGKVKDASIDAFDYMKTKVINVKDWIKDLAEYGKALASLELDDLMDTISTKMSEIKDKAKDIFDSVKNFFTKKDDDGKSISDKLKGLFGTAKDKVKEGFSNLKDFFKKDEEGRGAFGKLKDKFKNRDKNKDGKNGIFSSIKNIFSRKKDKKLDPTTKLTKAMGELNKSVINITRLLQSVFNKQDFDFGDIDNSNDNTNKKPSIFKRAFNKGKSVFSSIKDKVKGKFTKKNEDIPSHASGLDNVPNDDYKAYLHEGEMVLPSDVANEMRKRAGMKEEKSSKVKGKKNKFNSFVNSLPDILSGGDVLNKIYNLLSNMKNIIKDKEDIKKDETDNKKSVINNNSSDIDSSKKKGMLTLINAKNQVQRFKEKMQKEKDTMTKLRMNKLEIRSHNAEIGTFDILKKSFGSKGLFGMLSTLVTTIFPVLFRWFSKIAKLGSGFLKSLISKIWTFLGPKLSPLFNAISNGISSLTSSISKWFGGGGTTGGTNTVVNTTPTTTTVLPTTPVTQALPPSTSPTTPNAIPGSTSPILALPGSASGTSGAGSSGLGAAGAAGAASGGVFSTLKKGVGKVLDPTGTGIKTGLGTNTIAGMALINTGEAIKNKADEHNHVEVTGYDDQGNIQYNNVNDNNLATIGGKTIGTLIGYKGRQIAKSNVKGAIQTGKSMMLNPVTKQGGGKIATIINKIFNSKAFKSLAGSRIGRHLASIGKWVAERLSKTVVGQKLAQLAAKLTTKWGAIIGTGAISAGVIPVLWYGGTILCSVVKTNQMFELSPNYKPSNILKLIAGIAGLIDMNITMGFIDVKAIAQFIAGLVLSDKEKKAMAEGQDQLQTEYDQYVDETYKANQGKPEEEQERIMTKDQYNRQVNKGLFGKAWDGIKSGANSLKEGYKKASVWTAKKTISAVNWAGNKFEGAKKKVGEWWDDTKIGAQTVWETTKEKAGNALNTVKTKGSELLKSAKEKAGNWLEDSKLGIEAIKEIGIELWGKAREKLTDLKESVSDAANTANAKLGEIFGMRDDKTNEPLTMTEGIKQFVSNKVFYGKIALEELRDNCIELWNGAGNWIKERVTDLKDGVKIANKSLGKLLGFMDENGNPISLTEGIKQSVSEKLFYSKIALEELRDNCIELWNGAGKWFGEKVDEVKNVMPWVNLMLGMSFGFTDENGNTLPLTDGIKYKAKTWWEGSKLGVEAIKDTAVELWHGAGDWFGEKVEEVKNAMPWVNLMLGRTFGFTDEKGNILPLTDGIKHKAKTWWEGSKLGVEAIKDTAVDLWHGLGDGLGKLAKGVKDALGKLNKYLGKLFGFEDANGNPLSLTEGVKNNVKQWWEDSKLGVEAIYDFFFNTNTEGTQERLKERGTRNTNTEDTTLTGYSSGNGFGDGLLPKEAKTMSSLPPMIRTKHKTKYDNYGAGNGSSDGKSSSSGLVNGGGYYSQNDPKWSGVTYGTGTIGSSGCGPTSAAMMISSVTDNGVTPVDAANWSYNNGYRVPNVGTSWGFFPAYGAKYGVTLTASSDYSTVKEKLRQGYPAIFTGNGSAPFTSGGHLIFATGLDASGRVLINDPVSLERSIAYDFDHVASGARQAWIADKKLTGKVPAGVTTSGSNSTSTSTSGDSSGYSDSDNSDSGDSSVMSLLSELGSLTIDYAESVVAGREFNPNKNESESSGSDTSSSSGNFSGSTSGYTGSTKVDLDWSKYKSIGTSSKGNKVYGSDTIRSLGISNKEFIDLIAPQAQANQKEFKVPASTIMAQAILESGWGKSVIGNNLVGIKEGSGYNGPVVSTKTREAGIGTITDVFRGYNSINEGLYDHTKNVIIGNPSLYGDVVNSNWSASIDGLYNYATDPSYRTTLKSIVTANNLTKYNSGNGEGEGKTSTKVKSMSSLPPMINTKPNKSKHDLYGAGNGEVKQQIVDYKNALSLQLSKFNDEATDIIVANKMSNTEEFANIKLDQIISLLQNISNNTDDIASTNREIANKEIPVTNSNNIVLQNNNETKNIDAKDLARQNNLQNRTSNSTVSGKLAEAYQKAKLLAQGIIA